MATTGTSEDAGGRIDGRTARRDRNREAVLDAVVELFAEGNLDPGAHEVAQRSGVSLRSVYRYFEDLDALIAAAIERQLDRLRAKFDLARPGEGTVEERIERFSAHRVELYEAVRAVFLAARHHATTDTTVRATIQDGRERLAGQSLAMFAEEVVQLPPERARYVEVSIELLGQLDTLEKLRTICRLSRDETVDYVRTSLLRLLEL